MFTSAYYVGTVYFYFYFFMFFFFLFSPELTEGIKASYNQLSFRSGSAVFYLTKINAYSCLSFTCRSGIVWIEKKCLYNSGHVDFIYESISLYQNNRNQSFPINPFCKKRANGLSSFSYLLTNGLELPNTPCCCNVDATTTVVLVYKLFNTDMAPQVLSQ